MLPYSLGLSALRPQELSQVSEGPQSVRAGPEGGSPANPTTTPGDPTSWAGGTLGVEAQLQQGPCLHQPQGSETRVQKATRGAPSSSGFPDPVKDRTPEEQLQGGWGSPPPLLPSSPSPLPSHANP